MWPLRVSRAKPIPHLHPTATLLPLPPSSWQLPAVSIVTSSIAQSFVPPFYGVSISSCMIFLWPH